MRINNIVNLSLSLGWGAWNVRDPLSGDFRTLYIKYVPTFPFLLYTFSIHRYQKIETQMLLLYLVLCRCCYNTDKFLVKYCRKRRFLYCYILILLTNYQQYFKIRKVLGVLKEKRLL